MIELVILRLVLYIIALAFVLSSVLTIEAVPGNGSRVGLRLLLWPLMFYAGALVLATATKLCGISDTFTQWIFVIPVVLTIWYNIRLWKWWKKL